VSVSFAFATATVPARMASRNAPRPLPSGDTRPTPVTTTRWRGGAGASPGSRPSTRAQLLPPNANELDTTTFTSALRATCGTMSRVSASGSATLTVGGRTPSRTASTHTAASIAPAAPRVWPICDLVLLIGGGEPSKSASAAFVSALSLAGVPVPWPLT
jgi:hypothetical protein